MFENGFIIEKLEASRKFWVDKTSSKGIAELRLINKVTEVNRGKSYSYFLCQASFQL